MEVNSVLSFSGGGGVTGPVLPTRQERVTGPLAPQIDYVAAAAAFTRLFHPAPPTNI